MAKRLADEEYHAAEQSHGDPIFQLRVTLAHSRAPLWQRIQDRGSTPLGRFTPS